MNMGRVNYDLGDYVLAQKQNMQGLILFQELYDKNKTLDTMRDVTKTIVYFARLAATEAEQSQLATQQLGVSEDAKNSHRRRVQHMSQRAAHLWGASEAFRAEIDWSMPLYERTEFERLMTGVRETMGENMFEATQSQGSSMTPEEAVRYALEEPEAAR